MEIDRTSPQPDNVFAQVTSESGPSTEPSVASAELVVEPAIAPVVTPAIASAEPVVEKNFEPSTESTTEPRILPTVVLIAKLAVASAERAVEPIVEHAVAPVVETIAEQAVAPTTLTLDSETPALPPRSPDKRRKIPFADVTAGIEHSGNSFRAVDVDIRTLPLWLEGHFVKILVLFQGRVEQQILLDWITLECEDEMKKVCECWYFCVPYGANCFEDIA